jgi:hypothetical protein
VTQTEQVAERQRQDQGDKDGKDSSSTKAEQVAGKKAGQVLYTVPEVKKLCRLKRYGMCYSIHRKSAPHVYVENKVYLRSKYIFLLNIVLFFHPSVEQRFPDKWVADHSCQ